MLDQWLAQRFQGSVRIIDRASARRETDCPHIRVSEVHQGAQVKPVISFVVSANIERRETEHINLLWLGRIAQVSQSKLDRAGRNANQRRPVIAQLRKEFLESVLLEHMP